MMSVGRKPLSAAQCSIGLASSDSCPDGCFFGPSPPSSRGAKPFMRGIVEATESTQELSVAMRQGISEAVNVAMQQLMRGVWWGEVVVPILATNGHKLQLGVVFLLYPAFPVFTLATPELVLLHDLNREEAVRVLVCLQRFLSTSMYVPSDNRDPQPTMSQCAAELPNLSLEIPAAYLDQEEASPTNDWHPLEKRFLDKTKYYFKPLRSMFFAYGPSQVELSLRMHFRVMKALHRVEACREWAVFPICLREYDDDVDKSGLVYPRLDPARYRIGLPSDPDRRKQYFEAIWNAMNVIHNEARVLHLDLYPSNIMWRWDEECQRVHIKIIDWDAAVLMDWYEYSSETARVLVRNNRIRLASAYDNQITDGNDGLVMCSSMDTCFVSLMEEFQSDKRLYSEDKGDLDDAFRRLVETKLASTESVACDHRET